MEIMYDLYLFRHGNYNVYIKIPNLSLNTANEIAHDWIYKSIDNNSYGYLNDYYLVTTNSTPWPSPPKVISYDTDINEINFDKIKEMLNES